MAIPLLMELKDILKQLVAAMRRAKRRKCHGTF
jgi:hypothetical protein